MCPCESSTTLCVLPYLILDGRLPQSRMHSYLCSPSPMMGFLVPALSSDLRMYGAATTAPAARKPRRVMSSIFSSFDLSSRHYTTRVRHLRLHGRQHLFVPGHDAFGMTESAGALPVGSDIEHDVVGPH